MNPNPRVAFVIDALPSLGGGEKVLFTALELYPRADIFTLVYNQPVFANTPIANKKIKTSIINSLPFAHTHHRMFLPLMPAAIERFDLKNYDLIICLSYAVAHGVKNYGAAGATRHVSYTYTPMRYAWTNLNLNGTRTRKNLILDGLMQAFRTWDKRAASRVHDFAAISQTVSQRIADSYQRYAPIIYPPVDVARFKPNTTREDYYITITRLVPHKRIDIIVEAFARLNLPLVIVGTGPELPRLQKMASPNIRFTGYISDKQAAGLLGRARGFVCATEEDFGIALVEAQAAGCPVIAYGRGGALETVIEGETGLLFSEQAADSLIEGVRTFEETRSKFREVELIQNAKRFNPDRFKAEFKMFVESNG
jgi:glycosyltransferase involved in cell wall biosynthesis